MKYRLKHNNGRVKCLLKTGNDFVVSEMGLSAAEELINKGEVIASERTDYPIHVGEWYFEGVPVEFTTRKVGKHNG